VKQVAEGKKSRRLKQSMTEVTVGTQLKQLRKDEGMFAYAVAAKAGVTRAWLSQIENNKNEDSIRLELVERIADALGYKMNISFEKKI
jgi:transcriptional regulator with XRE-family HTH domain